MTITENDNKVTITLKTSFVFAIWAFAIRIKSEFEKTMAMIKIITTLNFIVLVRSNNYYMPLILLKFLKKNSEISNRFGVDSAYISKEIDLTF